MFVAEASALWIHGVAALLVTSCVIREDHLLAPLLRLPLLTRIGAVSYGMYLLHMLSYNVLRRGFDAAGFASRPIITFIAASALAFAAATVSYRHYESCFLRIGKRFSR